MRKLLTFSLLSLTLFSCGRISQMPLNGYAYQQNVRQSNLYRSSSSRYRNYSVKKSESERKNQFIIKFKSMPTRSSLKKYAEFYEFKIIKTTSLGVLAEKLSEESSEEFVSKLKKDPQIDYVEKNNTYRINK